MGLKSLDKMNEAFLQELWWRIETSPNDLWVRVLLGKYDRRNEVNEQPRAKQYDSRLWKEMVKVWDNYEGNTERADVDVGGVKWKLTTSGQFTTASAYKELQGHMANPLRVIWKKVWRIQAPERVSLHVVGDAQKTCNQASNK